VDVDPDMISAIIEKEYVKEREGRAGAASSSAAPSHKVTTARRDYDD
jgi:hypothetical protein